MILTFLLGLLAAVFAASAEPHVRRGIDRLNLDDLRLTATEMRLVTFAACLLLAALVSAALSNGSGLALMLGALVGLFLPRLFGG